MSVRRLLGLVTALIAGIALAAAAALAVLTTYLDRATTQVRTSMESVRAAEEVSRLLVVHDRHRFLAESTGHAAQLRRAARAERAIGHWLETLHEHVADDAEATLLGTLRTRVDAYRAARAALYDEHLSAVAVSSRVEPWLIAAQAAADKLLRMNVTQAEAAAALARRWDRAGNLLAMLVAAVVVGAAFTLVIVLRRGLVDPLRATRATIRRFGDGDWSARASGDGVREIGEIASAFNRMADALVDQRDRQLEFVAAIAHDLRNPLSALRIATAAAAAARDEASLRRAADIAARQVSRLERMVGDLLDTARIEAGRLELHRLPVDLRHLASHVVALLTPAAPRHRLTLEAPDVAVPVHADAQRMEQVLTNLVGNAIKYSPDGGPVAVSVDRHDGEAVVSVADAGVGIPAAELTSVFDPFRRGDGSRRIGPGAGLGLASARRIVEAHGGRIDVVSAPGRGSTFRVRLPVAHEGAPAGAA